MAKQEENRALKAQLRMAVRLSHADPSDRRSFAGLKRSHYYPWEPNLVL